MSDQIPTGYRFTPTDEELITSYLMKKVMGEQLPSDAVIEGEVYGDDVQLPEGNGDVEEQHIFVKLKKKNKAGTKMNRKTKNGYWKDNGCTKEILDKSGKHIIGTKRSLTFIDKSGSKRKKRWLMDEYGLVGSKIQKNSEEWVLCGIKQKNISPESHVSREDEDYYLTSTDRDGILGEREENPIEQTPAEIVVEPSHLQLYPPSFPLSNILMCAPGIDTNDVFEAAEKKPIEQTPIEIHVSQEGEDDCSTSIDVEIIEENPIQQTPFSEYCCGAQSSPA